MSATMGNYNKEDLLKMITKLCYRLLIDHINNNDKELEMYNVIIDMMAKNLYKSGFDLELSDDIESSIKSKINDLIKEIMTYSDETLNNDLYYAMAKTSQIKLRTLLVIIDDSLYASKLIELFNLENKKEKSATIIKEAFEEIENDKRINKKLKR